MGFQRLHVSPNTTSEFPPGSSPHDHWSPMNHQATFAEVNGSIARAESQDRHLPTRANPNNRPFWATGGQLSPNGQTHSATFLQASKLGNKRLHSSCSLLLNLAEGRPLALISWAMTSSWAGRKQWWLHLNTLCEPTILNSEDPYTKNAGLLIHGKSSWEYWLHVTYNL